MVSQDWLEHFTDLFIGIPEVVTMLKRVSELAVHLPLNNMLLDVNAPHLLPINVPLPPGTGHSHPRNALSTAVLVHCQQCCSPLLTYEGCL